MHKNIIISFLFLFSTVLIAQKEVELNCLQLNDKAMLVYQTNPDLALQILQKAAIKATQTNNSELIGITQNNFAILLRMKGEFLESKRLSNSVVSIVSGSLTKATIYNNIGACDRSLGLYYQSIKYYLKALKIYENLKDFKRQATVNNNIGMVFSALEQFDKAKIYYKKALKTFIQIDDKKGLSESYNNFAIALANQDSLQKSMLFFKKSLKIEEKLKDQKGIAESLNNVGGVHYYLGVTDSALFYYQKSAEIERLLKNFAGASESYNNIAQVYLELKQFPKAKKFIDSAYNHSQKSKVVQVVLTSLDNYKTYYENTGNFSAANKKIKEYYILKDSIQKIAKVKDINELETKYQTEKKEKLLLQKEAEAKQKNFLLLGVSAVAFFITLIAFLIYRQQKLKNQQQEQEFQLKTAISKIETQSKLQEQRLTISRDLHDNIGSQLTFIISSVDNVKYAFDIQNEKLDSKLSNISSFAKDTIVELRDTIWAMNNESISFEDLRMRMLNFIEKAQNSQENIDFNIDMDSTLNQYKWSSVAGMNIYRTIQEAINNALKYSKASLISIAVKEQFDQIQISIHDNGIGFDMENTSYGNGIANMKKRIEDNEGVFSIMAAQNQGTTITIQLKKEDNII